MNSLIATGRGDSFALVDQLAAELDKPEKQGQRTVVRAYPERIGELDAIAGLLKDALGIRDARFGGDEGAARIRIVPVTTARTLVVSASEESQKQIASLISGLEQSMSGPSQTTKVIAVEYANAAELAPTLKQFLADRRGAAGWGEWIRTGQVDGSIRSDIDPDAAGALILALTRGIAPMQLIYPDLVGLHALRAECDSWLPAALAAS